MVAARRISNGQKHVVDIDLDEGLGMDGDFHTTSQNKQDQEPAEKKPDPVPLDEQDKHIAAEE